MCNLYAMTAPVSEMKKLFGPFAGEQTNLPLFEEIYPGKPAPVLRNAESGLTLETMTWGFPGPAAAKGRPVTNIRNLQSPFWRSALDRPDRRCIVPVTRFCEWTADPHPVTKRPRSSREDRGRFRFASSGARCRKRRADPCWSLNGSRPGEG